MEDKNANLEEDIEPSAENGDSVWQPPPPPPQHPQRKRTTFWITIAVIATILIGAVAGVAGYCASGKCSTTSTQDSMVENDPSPVATPNTPTSTSANAPSIAATPQTPQTTFSNIQIQMACDFLQLSDVNNCLAKIIPHTHLVASAAQSRVKSEH